MEYKIIRATPEIGQIEIEYSDNGKVVATYAFDVPIVDNVFISGDALDAAIRLHAPTWVSQRELEVAAATGFSKIQSLVQAQEIEIEDDGMQNMDMWEQIQFEQRVAAALVKFGVLQSDPTAIPVGSL